eukprot:jgi/Mesvir1/13934/Mv02940-RA.1
MSNKLGVCMLAGGVGVNNAINGMADAQRNKVPMLVINGDVRLSYMGKGALQEFNNAKVVESFAKYSVNVEREEDVIPELQKAIKIALTPPCGVTLVSIPYDIQMPEFKGNYGFCSSDGAIEYVENEDLDCILILGTSLGQSATRDYNDVLVRGRKVIRIDWDTKEFNRVFKEDVSVCYDLREAVKILNKEVSKKNNSFLKPEMNKPYVKNHTGISLRRLYEMLPDIFPKDTCVIVDVGDFFNYIFKYMPIREDMDFQGSVNYACMGAGVAGALGSYLADKRRPYAVFVGDGGFYMNGMDILTAKEYNMPIMYFVINNSMFGLVKNGMKAIFGREFDAKVQFDKISIASIAEAMGIEAVQITDLSQVESLEGLMKDRTSPLLVEIVTDGTEIFIDTDRLKKVK